MPKTTILGFTPGRFLFVVCAMPALIACGMLTKQPWYELLLSMYSVVTLMTLAQGLRAGPACGVLFCLGYGALFFSRQVYGLAAFNTLFGAPVYLASFIAWGRHMDEKTVRAKKLSAKGWALALAVGAASFAGGYLLLRALGSQGALWDSLTLALVGPGLVLLLLRYVENWVFNLAGSVTVLIFWVLAATEDVSSLSFVLIAALQAAVNGVGLAAWVRLERKG
ncbi:MAG: nicotinamide riboside transporter PnuC [Firmicutes bacterium]|nr:nicotinamide riboside transporter PnuC [Bacillota bacterium]